MGRSDTPIIGSRTTHPQTLIHFPLSHFQIKPPKPVKKTHESLKNMSNLKISRNF